MNESKALEIAIEALVDLVEHSYSNEYDASKMHNIAANAIREIRREHYLSQSSVLDTTQSKYFSISF